MMSDGLKVVRYIIYYSHNIAQGNALVIVSRNTSVIMELSQLFLGEEEEGTTSTI